jgi:hypothetical protein
MHLARNYKDIKSTKNGLWKTELGLNARFQMENECKSTDVYSDALHM